MTEDSRKEKITRREFLEKAWWATVAAVVAGTTARLPQLEFPQELAPPAPSAENQTNQAAQAIKQFEATVGDSPLSFEQATAFIPTIARFLVASEGSPSSAKWLTQHTYIIHSADPEQFLADYPDAQVTQEDIVQVALLKNGMVDEKGNVLVNLLHTNQAIPDTPSISSSPSEMSQQMKVFPVVKFRSTVIHEMVHKEGKATWQPLDEELAAAYRRLRPFDKKKQEPATKKNLAIRFGEKNIRDKTNELVTDYRLAVVCSQHDLPVYLNYAQPIDIANFHAILIQAGISYKALQAFYRNSNISGFLRQIAAGAQNITLDSTQSLEFGLRHFYIFEDELTASTLSSHNRFADSRVPLERLAEYYPGIQKATAG